MKIRLLVLFLIISKLAHTQVPNWAWAKSAGGTNVDKSNYLAVDNLGNVYVTGYYDSPSISFGTYHFNSKGVFVTKYNTDGNVLWAKSFGAGSIDASYSIAADAYNNIYLTGTFFSTTIAFDNITLTNTSDLGFGDVYIVKLNSNGQVLWAKSMGGANREFGFNVTTDKSGNVYVTGSFYSSVMFIGSFTLNNAGSQNLFITKYDQSGNVIWAKSAAGNFGDNSLGIVADNKENIYVTGYFYSSSINFGGITLLNNTTNGSYDDMFIAKYNPSGNVIWAKSAGGSEHDFGTSITADDDCNIYTVGGFYSPSISFGTFSFTNTNPGESDIFLAKYDSAGNVAWAKSVNGVNFDIAHSITYGKGSLYLVGYFSSPSLSVGATVLNNSIVSTPASFDLLLIKYDMAGNVVWAKSFGGNGNDGTKGDEGPCVKTDILGNVFVTGFYENYSIKLDTITLPNQGSDDVFIAKLNELPLPPTPIDSSCRIDVKTKIYPNPLNQLLIVDKHPTICPVSMSIYNMLGQLMLKDKMINNGHNEIKVSNFAKGIYNYKFISGNTVLLSGQFIKQ